MSQAEEESLPTQHALLTAWGVYARKIGILQQLEAVALHQKIYRHAPQTKVIEYWVATLAGLRHLKEISRSAHPLDQDPAVAKEWGQPAWADYSGVSRTLQSLTWPEAEQIVQAVWAASQLWIAAEVNRALLDEKRLVYDGDLTGLAVSKSSTTYPGVAYGYVDGQIRLGYQMAVVSLHSLTHPRLWLSGTAHPGNLVSAQAAAEMVQAAEARTGLRPWRRTDLLEQRLQAMRGPQQSLEKKQVVRQEKVIQARQALEQVSQQVREWLAWVAQCEQDYQAKGHPERPESQLAKARQKLDVLQKRRQRREQALEKTLAVAEWGQGLVQQHQADMEALQERLARFRQDNLTNPRPIQAVFRLDAGFGTHENLALLIEMGYEVYTKLHSYKLLVNLLQQVPAQAVWTPVAAQADVFAREGYPIESFPYPLDVAFERFMDGDRVKHCALLHFGPTPVTQDLPAWFEFYTGRQGIEAGIKENKQIFHLHRLKVRSGPAIYVQENFVLFAANFIHWANDWLAEGHGDRNLPMESLGLKECVQVAAHTSADLVWSSTGKLLRFSQHSLYAGKVLKFPDYACQLPLPLGKSYDFCDV